MLMVYFSPLIEVFIMLFLLLYLMFDPESFPPRTCNICITPFQVFHNLCDNLLGVAGAQINVVNTIAKSPKGRCHTAQSSRECDAFFECSLSVEYFYPRAHSPDSLGLHPSC